MALEKVIQMFQLLLKLPCFEPLFFILMLLFSFYSSFSSTFNPLLLFFQSCLHAKIYLLYIAMSFHAIPANAELATKINCM